jgi:hypothetical protein
MDLKYWSLWVGPGPGPQTLGSLFFQPLADMGTTYSVTLGQVLDLQILNFCICVMGVLVPTSQDYTKEEPAEI